jgi:hypothetical protein
MDACLGSYEEAARAIAEAAIGRGNKQKLATKVENAWRMARSVKQNGRRNAVQQLDTALRLLQGPPTKAVEASVRAELTKKIRGLRDCVQGGGAADTATLVVRTYEVSYIAPDLRGAPAAGGTILLVDGEEVGVTRPDGTATLTVPARTIALVARRYPSSGAWETLTLSPRETRTVDIVLLDGKEIAEDTTLEIVEAPEGVLPLAFTAMTLRFVRDEAVVRLRRVFQIDVLHPTGGPSTAIASHFALQADGTLTATDVAAVRALLETHAGKVELMVHAVDQEERNHTGVVALYVGRHRVVARLVAPPSAPGLPAAAIPFVASILNTDLVFNGITDAEGKVELPSLPSGALSFRAEAVADGKFYYGRGAVTMNRSWSLAINLRHVSDVLAGVPGFVASPIAAAVASKEESDEPKVEPRTEPRASLQASATSFEYDVFVQSGAENVERVSSHTETMPKGTKRLYMSFLVQSDEYPVYVTSQSVFNDVWSVKVMDGPTGQMLWEVGPIQVNSQLFSWPVWQGDGTTGHVGEFIDLFDSTADEDRPFTMVLTSMNVGDSIYPTRVWGRLEDKPEVKILAVDPDANFPTTGDNRYFSIPRAGDTNVFERFLEMRYTKPETATVENVKVELLGPGPLMTILDEGPGANVDVKTEDFMRVRVSLHDTASELSGVPPECHGIKYKVTLTCTLENGESEEDTKETEHLVALWHMPDGFARFSRPADPGDDDWCSRGAYFWLQANKEKVTAINDISGEHARDIGHVTHANGTDIDMFHWYRYPDAVSARNNYDLLTQDVLVMGSDHDALSRVASWVEATRAGIDALAPMVTVRGIYYAWGAKLGTQVDEGWAWQLLMKGTITVAGVEYDLSLGDWFQYKYVPRSDHDDHVHVILNRDFLDG